MYIYHAVGYFRQGKIVRAIRAIVIVVGNHTLPTDRIILGTKVMILLYNKVLINIWRWGAPFFKNHGRFQGKKTNPPPPPPKN